METVVVYCAAGWRVYSSCPLPIETVMKKTKHIKLRGIDGRCNRAVLSAIMPWIFVLLLAPVTAHAQPQRTANSFPHLQTGIADYGKAPHFHGNIYSSEIL